MTEFRFVLTDQLQEACLGTLFPNAENDGMLERGFIGIVTKGIGIRRQTLFLRRIIEPRPGDVSWVYRLGLGFSPKYFSRALDQVAEEVQGAGLLLVHGHPGFSRDPSVTPVPSSPDLRHERELLCQTSRALPAGAPVAAGIMAPSGAWRIREYVWPRPLTVEEAKSRLFGPRAGSKQDADIVHILGAKRTIVRSSKTPKFADLSPVDSTVRLWGEKGQEFLGALRTGVVGCGGLGSILIEFLARLGVGEIVAVDYDILERDNLNRAVGSRPKNVGKPKVEYLERWARTIATAPWFKFTAVRGSAFEDAGMRPLLDCDYVFSAADDAAARQVLDHIAYAYGIPVADGGTTLVVDSGTGVVTGKSQATEAGWGRPCLQCAGVYNLEEVTMRLEEENLRGAGAYIVVAGDELQTEIPRAPSVISNNGLVASIMVQRFLRTVLGFPPEEGTGVQRYYVEEGQLLWGAVKTCKEGCPKADWFGLGDSHALPTGVDTTWKKLQDSPR